MSLARRETRSQQEANKKGKLMVRETKKLLVCSGKPLTGISNSHFPFCQLGTSTRSRYYRLPCPDHDGPSQPTIPLASELKQFMVVEVSKFYSEPIPVTKNEGTRSPPSHNLSFYIAKCRNPTGGKRREIER